MGSRHSIPKDQRIVIVGGGYAGVHLAYQLKKDGADFVIISSRDAWHHNVASVRACVDQSFIKKTLIPLKDAFGEQFIHGKVTSIDSAGNTISLESGKELKYDVLILATGSTSSFPHKLKDETSQEATDQYQEIAQKLQEAKRVVIIGGGATGVEQAAEIMHNRTSDTQLTLIHSSGKLVNPKTSDKFQKTVLTKLENMGVKVILGEKVQEIENYENYNAGPVQVKTDKGTTIDADFTLKCIGVQINSGAYKDSLGDSVCENGKLEVNKSFQVKGHTNIFAIGDCSNTGDPMLAFAANEQAKHLHYNLKMYFNHQNMSPYKADKMPVVAIVTLGPGEGVGESSWGFMIPEFIIRGIKSKDMMVKRTWGEVGLSLPN